MKDFLISFLLGCGVGLAIIGSSAIVNLSLISGYDANLKSELKVQENGIKEEIRKLQNEIKKIKKEQENIKVEIRQLKKPQASEEKAISKIVAYIEKVNKKVPGPIARRIAKSVLEASKDFRVPVSVILAVIHQESHFNKDALSPTGCIGLMQVNPYTWVEKLKLPDTSFLWDIDVNIRVGTYILRYYFERTGSWKEALYRYYGISEFGKIYKERVIRRAWRLVWIDKLIKNRT